MRILPILTALVVCGVLYLLVLDRDTLMGIASGNAAPASADMTAADAAPDATATLPHTETERVVPVVARIFRQQEVQSVVILRGQTQAARSVEVRAETAGKVASAPLRRGRSVTEGEVLCRLDEGTRAAALAEAEARLAEAQLNARNATALQAGGFAAETRTLSTRSALQGAEAAVEAARRELARLEIRAPFGGILEDDTAELGSLLQPGGLCARVIQLDPVHLVGFAPEAEIDRVILGARAGGRLIDGTEVFGTVSFVARSADPATRTFRVEVTVPNPDMSIRDGQSVEIAIGAAGIQAHLVPGSALTLDDDGALGLRVVDQDSRARFVPVRPLRDTAEGIWVVGLPAEATVITIGQEFVIDGVAVAPTIEEAAQ